MRNSEVDYDIMIMANLVFSPLFSLFYMKSLLIILH